MAEEAAMARIMRMEEGEKFLYKQDCLKLVSAEGYDFIVDKKAAAISNTLRLMLSSIDSSAEAELIVMNFPKISTPILEKVCEYCYWSLQFSSGQNLEFHIEPEVTLELLMASDYLRL